MNGKITPSNIDTLLPDQVFVFGSNRAGYHGAGAAKTAYLKFGAEIGVGYGLRGNSFALPTKDYGLKTLPISFIAGYVGGLIKLAKCVSNKTFLVTEIGCGLAGYTPEQIAPLFKDAVDVPNIHLPQSFWDVLKP